jgi:hypothetical protein
MLSPQVVDDLNLFAPGTFYLPTAVAEDVPVLRMRDGRPPKPQKEPQPSSISRPRSVVSEHEGEPQLMGGPDTNAHLICKRV